MSIVIDIASQGNYNPFIYDGLSKIFQTVALEMIKLTIRSIAYYHPQSSSLPHADTVPTVFFNFGMLPGIPFLSECQALSLISRISSKVSYQCPFSFSFIFGNRKKPQGAK
jgi:hypothetical protein